MVIALRTTPSKGGTQNPASSWAGFSLELEVASLECAFPGSLWELVFTRRPYRARAWGPCTCAGRRWRLLTAAGRTTCVLPHVTEINEFIHRGTTLSNGYPSPAIPLYCPSQPPRGTFSRNTPTGFQLTGCRQVAKQTGTAGERMRSVTPEQAPYTYISGQYIY